MLKRLALLAVLLLCCAGAVLVETNALASTEAKVKALHLTPAPPAAPSTAMAVHPVVQPATVPPAPTEPVISSTTVQQAMQSVLPEAQTGFEVFDLQTGQVLASQNAGQQFASMSVVKLLIAIDLLGRGNWAPPDADAQQTIHQMLATSDDDIADTLWGQDGGPAIVSRVASLISLTGTQPPADPGEWGDTQITAKDMVAIYRYVTTQVPQPARDIILGALSSATKTAADGTDQYFGIPDGLPNTSWAVKQGWGTSGSQAEFNTTGLINNRYVVVILTSAPENSYSTLPTALTAAAGTLAGPLTQPN